MFQDHVSKLHKDILYRMSQMFEKNEFSSNLRGPSLEAWGGGFGSQIELASVVYRYKNEEAIKQ